MAADKSKIIYTLTDEAPLLATCAFLPVIRAFAAPAGVAVEESDISVAGRILGEFPDYLTDEQMVLDLRAAAAWLDGQAKVLKKKYGLLGHCMGGRTTWVGLEEAPELWACGCIWYGGSALKPMGKLPAPIDRLDRIQAPVMGFSGKNRYKCRIRKHDRK